MSTGSKHPSDPSQKRCYQCRAWKPLGAFDHSSYCASCKTAELPSPAPAPRSVVLPIDDDVDDRDPWTRSPMVWDGHTRYSGSSALRERYVAVCSLCSRSVPQVSQDAGAWREAVATLRCVHCQGCLLIQRVDGELASGGAVDPSRVLHPLGRTVLPIRSRVTW